MLSACTDITDIEVNLGIKSKLNKIDYVIVELPHFSCLLKMS